MIMDSDLSRQEAFANLSACSERLRESLNDFLAAVEDPRLTAAPCHPPNDHPLRDGLTFASLCDALQSEFFPLLDRFSDLLRLVHAKVNSIRNHSVQLIPIHRFPTEILAAMFVRAAEVDDELSWCETRPTPTRAPDTISHVCHLWRAVSLRTPQLWTHIDWCGTSAIERLPTILERCGTLSLDLCFCFKCTKTPATMTNLFDLILPFSRRWSNLTIHNNETLLFSSRLESIFDGSRLRSLKLRSCSPTVVSSLLRVASSKFQRLTKFSYRYLHLNGLPPPHDQLKNFDLTVLDLSGWGVVAASTLNTILQGCSQLQELSLSMSFVKLPTPSTQQVPEVRLPHLRSLRFFDGFDVMHFRSLLLSMRTPSLKSLDITAAWDLGGLDAVAQFLMQSNPPIHCLRLRNFTRSIQFSATQFSLSHHQLESLVSIEELRLEGGSSILSNETLDKLTPSPDGGCACPNLKVLHLDGLRCSPGRLATLIEGRQGPLPGVRPLALVYVNCEVYGDQGYDVDSPDVRDRFVNFAGYIDWKFDARR
jgi:hypothetical protein